MALLFSLCQITHNLTHLITSVNITTPNNLNWDYFLPANLHLSLHTCSQMPYYYTKISTSRFSGVPNTMVKVWNLYLLRFLRYGTLFSLNTFLSFSPLSLAVRGLETPSDEVFRYAARNGTGFKAVSCAILEKTHFCHFHHFPLLVEGQK